MNKAIIVSLGTMSGHSYKHETVDPLRGNIKQCLLHQFMSFMETVRLLETVQGRKRNIAVFVQDPQLNPVDRLVLQQFSVTVLETRSNAYDMEPVSGMIDANTFFHDAGSFADFDIDALIQEEPIALMIARPSKDAVHGVQRKSRVCVFKSVMLEGTLQCVV